MTNKEKKQYLSRYRNLERKIGRLLEEKEHWRTKAEKVTTTITDMPRGSDVAGNQRELAICNLADCIDQTAEKINEQLKVKAEIEKTIESVEDGKLELLLAYRYIDGRRWEDITQLLGCSWRQTHYLHARALQKINIK